METSGGYDGREGEKPGRLQYHNKVGSEGPSHDPYSYSETTIWFRGRKIEFHDGLAMWLKVDGEKYKPAVDRNQDFGEYEKQLYKAYKDKIEEVLGFSLTQLERWNRKLKSKCRKCGSKNFKWVSGFPGESLLICSDCNDAIDYNFNESAII